MTNVIDLDARRRSQGPGNDRISVLAEKLRMTARIALEDRPVLAKNLGRLAHRIAPSDPLAGARKMFGPDSPKWGKRKRLIRLPSEEAPSPQSYGAYEGAGSAYVGLAKAAGTILASSNDPEAVDRAQRETLRELMLDTSLLSRFAPTLPADRDVVDLLHTLSEQIGRLAAEETRIIEAWKTLQTAPLQILPACGGQVSEVDHANVRLKVPAELSALLGYSDEVFFSSPSNGFGWDSMSWAEPTVHLGYVARPFQGRLFLLPPDLSATVEPEEYDTLPDKVIAWLEAVSPKPVDYDRPLPDVRWSESEPYGWKKHELSAIHHVELTLSRAPDNTARLQLSLTGPLGGYPTFVLAERSIEQSTISADAHELVCLDLLALGDNYVKGLFRQDSTAALIGLFDHWGDYNLQPSIGDYAEGWVDDDVIGPIILGQGARFYPTIEAPALTVPCQGESVAAALLRNIRGAEQSVDQRLLKKAAIISEAVFKCHEGLVRSFGDSIRSITIAEELVP